MTSNPNNGTRPSHNCGGRVLLLCVLVVIAGGAWRSASLYTHAADPPATQPAPVARPVFPGVELRWHDGVVLVAADVVLRSGPLEFLACWSGKEHESVLRFAATPEHVYAALGLIGIEPGTPPTFDPNTGTWLPPRGPLIDIAIRDAAGHLCPATDWLLDVEYSCPPLTRPFVYTGSRITADRRLACGDTGAGLALVDFPEALFSCTQRHSSANSLLWARCNTARIPPVGTRVQLQFTRARATSPAVRFDACGVARVDGRYARLADVVDLLCLTHELDPQWQPDVVCTGTLLADRLRIAAAFRAAQLPTASLFAGTSVAE